MRRRQYRPTQAERAANVAAVAQQAAELALCHLGYRNGLRWTDERFEEERRVLSEALQLHLRRVEIRHHLGTPIPAPAVVDAEEGREEVSRLC
jgi:hypothetical protein